jgi:transposase
MLKPDRKGERSAAHLEHFSGCCTSTAMPASSGWARGNVVLAACWAHTRRYFYEFFEANGSPVAAEALRRIGELYAIEERIRGQSPAHRLAERLAPSKPSSTI